jgi:peptidoglycan/LPS O-acetylase OafA/YrhL
MTENKTASKMAGWWRSDENYERVAWAVIFFLGAALLLVEVSGIADGIGWYNGWAIFFLGLGSVMVLGAIARRTALGRRVEGLGAFCGIILVAVGLDGILGFDLFWPIILVVIGALVLHSAFARPKLDGDVDDWDMPS